VYLVPQKEQRGNPGPEFYFPRGRSEKKEGGGERKGEKSGRIRIRRIFALVSQQPFGVAVGERKREGKGRRKRDSIRGRERRCSSRAFAVDDQDPAGRGRKGQRESPSGAGEVHAKSHWPSTERYTAKGGRRGMSRIAFRPPATASLVRKGEKGGGRSTSSGMGPLLSDVAPKGRGGGGREGEKSMPSERTAPRPVIVSKPKEEGGERGGGGKYMLVNASSLMVKRLHQPFRRA